jgi:hypothetical protein
MLDLQRPARAFLGQKPARRSPIPTGIATLDQGLGGLPRGAVLEIRGAPGQGKSSFAAGLLEALTPRAGAAVVDLSGDFPRVAGAIFARAHGGDHALQLIRALLDEPAVELLLVDPARAIGDTAGRPQLLWTLPALHARAIQTNTALIFVDTGLDAHRAPALFHIDAGLELAEGRLRLRPGSPRFARPRSAPARGGPS